MRPEYHIRQLGDVSLPLGLRQRAYEGVRGGAGASASPGAAELAAIAACDAPWQRRHWLTFRGSVYLVPEAGWVRQNLLYR